RAGWQSCLGYAAVGAHPRVYRRAAILCLYPVAARSQWPATLPGPPARYPGDLAGRHSYLWRLHLRRGRAADLPAREKAAAIALPGRGGAGAAAGAGGWAPGKLHQPGTVWPADDAALGAAHRSRAPRAALR